WKRTSSTSRVNVIGNRSPLSPLLVEESVLWILLVVFEETKSLRSTIRVRRNKSLKDSGIKTLEKPFLSSIMTRIDRKSVRF
ncbi:MAG TPA: hypothetical protein VJ044_00135, partial [Candidatus Hodarchaeales archaeon]|nr:hypothetical protein [Candidatus Hodarchaeales archaeon]